MIVNDSTADAVALVALARLAADPAAAEAKLSALVSETKALAAVSERAKKARAESEASEEKARAALEGLATRVAEFEAWSSGTSKAHREREEAIVSREAELEKREHRHQNTVADFEQRQNEHTLLMGRLKQHFEGAI